ncbi:hypothetical protein [Mucilaginibacter boryungensis]|uniref:Uncharacterized protein n=1 Tax=Mucilaginibacter boryungensis TaxID=768480 RepID=A0ABR9XMA6_9SPHI|nr:hypothetical protein [Mucilaginibacter boryungensis]MBE9668229.1 hypothetical protein [Mucilaginibacter boryungensis]
MATIALNHTYRHFADLQLSTKEFYDRLEQTIKSYQYPDINFYRRDISTYGFFSVKREYLLIERNQYLFYVCAAPYGRSFFISWWFQYERSSFLDWVYQSPLMSALFEDKATTMFSKDTQLMFQNAINSIITEVTATVQATHGARMAAPLAQQQLS